MAYIQALDIARGGFPTPLTEGWRLVRVQPGRFADVEEAEPFVPAAPGTYVVAIGLGQEMEWEIIRR